MKNKIFECYSHLGCKIAYKLSNESPKFCSYKISRDEQNSINTFQLEYTQGTLGDFNEWKYFISENEEEIREFENEILIDFPDTIISQNSITISITISEHFLKDQKLETLQVTKWIQRAIEYACFNSGLGVVTELETQTVSGETYFTFNTELNILYSSILSEILQELMIPWGIDFSNSKNSVTVTKHL
jgi:hypothetical protein